MSDDHIDNVPFLGTGNSVRSIPAETILEAKGSTNGNGEVA